MKLLTIAIPSYNVEHYLERCLNTLIKVELPRRLEILIINDGSTDQTAVIAKEYTAKYSDFITLINKENGGHGSAINTALSLASGKYFMVLDGDDWINPESLSVLLSMMEKIDVDLISTNYRRVDMKTGDSSPVIQQDIDYGRIYSFEELNVDHIYFALASSCFRTSLLTQNNITLQENTFYVDVEYILMPIPFVQTVIFYDLFLYRYYVGNTQQSIYIPTMVKRYSHHERVMKRVICYLQYIQTTDKHKKYIENIMKQLLYTHYSIALVYNPDKNQGYKQAQRFDGFLKKQDPHLYVLSGKTIPFLHIARMYHYNYDKYSNSFIYYINQSPYYIMSKKLLYKLKLNKIYHLLCK